MESAKTTLQIVNCDIVALDVQAVIRGEEPVGYLSERFGVQGFMFVLRDSLRYLAIGHALFVVRYPVILLNGELDYYWVLCIASSEERYNRLQAQIPGFSEKCRSYDQTQILSTNFGNDTISAFLTPVAFYSERENRQVVGAGLPSTADKVFLAGQERLSYFLHSPDQHCRLGHLLGTNIKMGLVLRHFGQGRGGWGDARMMGIFGATGSGKTRFAAQVISGYAAHSGMGILIIDPQGQFGKRDVSGKHIGEIGLNADGTPWSMGEAFRRSVSQRSATVIDVANIAFNQPALFVHLLRERSYFIHFYRSMAPVIQSDVVELFTDYLKNYFEKKKYSDLSQLCWTSEIYEDTKNIIISKYAKNGEEKVENYISSYNSILYKSDDAHYKYAQAIWEEVLALFSGTFSIKDIIKRVLIDHEIIIISLADLASNFDVNSLKKLYCAEILEGLRKASESYYYRPSLGGRVNALVVIDEVQRLASQEQDDKLSERINLILIDAVRTTRKLSVGWLFITQSLRALDAEIFGQLNTKVFGFGLASNGQDEILKNAIGNQKDIIERYRTMPIPKTSGVYAFLVVGEMLPLGNGSLPIFLNSFSEQSDLFAANPQFFA